MDVDEATVRRIARLARIKVSAAEVSALEQELSGIFKWIKQLDEVEQDENVSRCPLPALRAAGLRGLLLHLHLAL